MRIAILGFGVVGQGTAGLLMENEREIAALTHEDVEIAYVLDLRDFPDSPLADRVVHSIAPILSDERVGAVIEVMGGSHPAYEYTIAALRAGKHVITSNKEVVARYGDEFLQEAAAHGVSYRFEAAVGGGIPVIAPLISLLRHNRLREVRGILNGTTNYILTKMFTLGDSFSDALADAQARGYAERDPAADILGLDACRKIAILAALMTGQLFPTDSIHTEGITGIRPADVQAAESAGYRIKLLGRARLREGGAPEVTVAPYLIPCEEPLATVSGVYNAVEVVAEPLGNIMLYGQGAGAGATASAVVSDLVTVMTVGTHGIVPHMQKSEALTDFATCRGRHYLAVPQAEKEQAMRHLATAQVLADGEEYAVITEELTEGELADRLAASGLTVLSHLRLL